MTVLLRFALYEKSNEAERQTTVINIHIISHILSENLFLNDGEQI